MNCLRSRSLGSCARAGHHVTGRLGLGMECRPLDDVERQGGARARDAWDIGGHPSLAQGAGGVDWTTRLR